MEQLSLKLEVFEGPLDLLIHLLEKNKMNLYDIPIAEITEQYLAYLEQMQEYSIELSSEFLVMAAHLLLVKSKMLLPKPPKAEEEDPRQSLVDRLIAYKQFKEISEMLKERNEQFRLIFYKNPDEELSELSPEITIKGNMEKLMQAFYHVMTREKSNKLPEPKFFEQIVPKESVSVESRSKVITEKLKKDKKLRFKNLFDHAKDRSEMVANFLAILDLLRNEKITMRVLEDEIIFYLKKNGEQNVNGE